MKLRKFVGIEDPTKAIRRNQSLYAMLEGEIKSGFTGVIPEVVYHSDNDPLFNGGKQLYSYVLVQNPTVLAEVKAHPALVGFIEHSPYPHKAPVPTVYKDDVVEGQKEPTKVFYMGAYQEMAPSVISELVGPDCMIYAVVTPSRNGRQTERVDWADHWFPVVDRPSVKFDVPEFTTMSFDVVVFDQGSLDSRSDSYTSFRTDTYIDEIYRLVKIGGLVKYCNSRDGIKNAASKFCSRFDRPLAEFNHQTDTWQLCGIRKERIKPSPKAVADLLDFIKPQRGLEATEVKAEVFNWVYPLPGEDLITSKHYEDATVPMHATIHKHGDKTMKEAEAILADLVDKVTAKKDEKDQFEVSLKMGSYSALAEAIKENAWGIDPDFAVTVSVQPPLGFDIMNNENGFVSLSALSEYGKASVPVGIGSRNGYIVEIENGAATLPALRAYAESKGWEVIAKGQKPTLVSTTVSFTWSPQIPLTSEISVHVKEMNQRFAERTYSSVEPHLTEQKTTGKTSAKKSGKRNISFERVVPVEPSLVNATKLLSDLPPQILIGGEKGDGAVILATGRVDKEEIITSIPDEEYGVIESVLTKPVSKFVVYPLDQPSADVLDCQVGDWIIASDI